MYIGVLDTFFNCLPTFPGHAFVSGAHPVAGAEPSYDQSLVRTFHQGRSHGPQFHSEVQEEVRHHPPLQTHEPLRVLRKEEITAILMEL